MSKPTDSNNGPKALLKFASEHKAYWIVPLLVALMLLAIVIVGGKPPAPFEYSPF